MHPHLILGQRTGLIGADYRNGPHGLAGVHFADQVIGFQHAAHIDGQRQRHAHRQPLGHRNDNQRHRHHEILQHSLGNGQPIGLQQPLNPEAFHQQRHKSDNCQGNSGTADQFRKTLQLLVERRLFVALNGRLFGHLTEFSSVPDPLNNHDSMSFDHRRTAQYLVRRIGRIFMEMGRIDRFIDHRFTGQCRFVDLQRDSLLQRTIGRNLFSAFEQDNIPNNDILFWDLGHGTVTDNFDRRIVVGTVQQVEFAHSVVLEPKGDSGSQKDFSSVGSRHCGHNVHGSPEPEPA